MWRDGESKTAVIARISEAINAPDYSLPVFREKVTRGKKILSAPDATTMLALRKMDRNIRAVYGVKQANRDDLVYQVKALLQEGCPFTVLRLDIRSFYESIDRRALLDKLARDAIVSYMSRSILEKLFSTPQVASLRGLPRGIAASATLAELYMRELDQEIRGLHHVYFYGRYVDDMVIFTHALPRRAEEDIVRALARLGLRSNPSKRTIIECSATTAGQPSPARTLDFLGYQFQFPTTPPQEKKWRAVSVHIAPKKIRKLKTRIVHALIDYGSVPDFAVLFRRLRFLTDNYQLRGGVNGRLHGGIHYNYRHITDVRDLSDLDAFLRRLVFCRKGSLGSRLESSLTGAQRRRLARLSFKAGFEARFSRGLPPGGMNHIRKCWAYEKN